MIGENSEGAVHSPKELMSIISIYFIEIKYKKDLDIILAQIREVYCPVVLTYVAYNIM